MSKTTEVNNKTGINRSDSEPLAKSADIDLSGVDISAETGVSEMEKILFSIKQDPEYIKNINYGQIRKGHPEGSIKMHIAELEQNITLIEQIAPNLIPPLSLSLWQLTALRILANVHDTFKGVAKRGVPIDDDNSHASMAKRYLERFTGDQQLLSVVQEHDVPYSLFRNYQRFGDLDETRFQKLCASIKDWDLFLLFQIVDNTTMGKIDIKKDPVEWFINLVQERNKLSNDYQPLQSELKRRLLVGQ